MLWDGIWTYEVKELLRKILEGNAEVIIRLGGIVVYGSHIILLVDMLRRGTLVHLLIRDLEGTSIEVPNLVEINEVIKTIRYGLFIADGYIQESRVTIGTSQTWQNILVAFLFPGKIHSNIIGIDVNKKDVKLMWFLRTDYTPGDLLFEINNNTVIAALFGAILGDGSVTIRNVYNYKEPVIDLTNKDFNDVRWRLLLSELVKGRTYPMHLMFLGSKAIDMARRIVNVMPPTLKELMDALNVSKWVTLREMANMELKWRRGKWVVNVLNYKFSVATNPLMLYHYVKSEDEAQVIINILKENGIEAHRKKSGQYIMVVIPARSLNNNDNIKIQTI
ncbi:hypothetical protein [Vulcanisaeta souniana]|uniref:Uncharacterized protein n=1 Tax=Vulcanisaeta souniana JCM 11219 TaxID=1293586 RepID=A0A830EMC3_9CREN|nr:hypothetical protein [Vulcanisaeta souniana]BDR91265.1 hypothetical protein Vsou_03580 [Vulcanisaeta souniana JCM 11219]GGI84985.1 hypothetical protein GCM10007112_22470 [Vulcanisaeta souniana JCM 11219]